MITQDLGIATAYGYAKSKGYTGTEAEFAELMASYAEVGQTAVTAAQTATTKASEAATSATTATNKATEATTAATTATTKAGEASTSASTATSAKDTAASAASTATTKATEATTAAATATSAKTDAVAANTAAQSAKTAAQTAQTGAETAAASVEASAAQIQTNADDISELKEDLNTLNDIIGEISIIPNAEILKNKYVTADGTITTSVSWNAYKFDLTNYVPKSISVWTNNALFLAIAFYSSSDMSSSTLVGGIAFGSSDESTAKKYSHISIPDGALYAVISNRKQTSTEIEINGIKKDFASFPSIIDAIKMQSVTDVISTSGVYGKYYIASDGNLNASGAWATYSIPVDFYSLFTKTISNSIGSLAIAFYNSETPNASSLISGIYYATNGTFEENTVDYDDVPDGTKLILVSTRTASSTDHVITITTLIDDAVEKLAETVSEIQNELLSFTGKSNVKAIYKNVPNTNDFAIIKDEIWFAENQYVDGVATDTTYIHRYKIVDGNLQKISDMITDFGHWNVVDYCEENDCLIFGNGANSTSTVGNYFSVIPHPLTLSGTVSIEDVGFKCPVDIGFKVQAVWGDNNFGKYDIAYVFANNATTICVIQLLKDANGDFTGEFRTLETLTSETSIGVGGADFWGDDLYIGDGGLYGLYKLSMTDLSAKRIVKKYYTESGTLYAGTTQGVHVDSDYIWVFSNVGGSSESYLIQYYR